MVPTKYKSINFRSLSSLSVSNQDISGNKEEVIQRSPRLQAAMLNNRMQDFQQAISCLNL